MRTASCAALFAVLVAHAADDPPAPPQHGVLAAQDGPVLIGNRLRRRPTEAMEVVLARVDDGVALDRTAEQNTLSPGSHVLEALCITRHPGGMANFTRQTTTTLPLEARPGARYRLEGRIDDNERCVAMLIPDDEPARAPDS